MHYDFAAVPDPDVPQAGDAAFRHVISTPAFPFLGCGKRSSCSGRRGSRESARRFSPAAPSWPKGSAS